MKRFVLLLALLVLFSAIGARAQAPTPVPGDSYIGELFLFRLDEVVVVYPAGPGENALENRRSADARAAFLTTAHGVKTSVVADDALGTEQRHKHLLVLGWGNRVIGTADVPSPFKHSPEGVEFLGSRESDPSLDLMFFAPSPFDPKRVLVFWSRIDPERDRMIVLPAVGSDWAMYRDFRIVRQGMLQKEPTWPPKRDEEAEKDHARDLRRLAAGEITATTEHFEIEYNPARVNDADIESIKKARESAFARAAAAVGQPPEGFRILLRVYDDEQAKEKRTGLADAAHSVPAAQELHMTRRAAKTPSPHEEIHIIARFAIGPCRLTTMYEGLAIAEEKSYRGLDLDVYAATMLAAGTFPATDDLLDEEKARGMQDTRRYPAAGLLVTWIRETGGAAAFKKAYTLPEGSLSALALALGKPKDAVETTFKEWVKRRAAARGDDVTFLKIQSEAQERLTAGDYAGVAAAMKRALALRPNDLQVLFNLASAEMRTRSYAAAEEHLKRVISLATGPKDSMYLIFGHYQLGRLFDVQSRREDALAEYRKVLELPDQKDVHRLAREAIEKPATAESLQ